MYFGYSMDGSNPKPGKEELDKVSNLDVVFAILGHNAKPFSEVLKLEILPGESAVGKSDESQDETVDVERNESGLEMAKKNLRCFSATELGFSLWFWSFLFG